MSFGTSFGRGNITTNWWRNNWSIQEKLRKSKITGSITAEVSFMNSAGAFQAPGLNFYCRRLNSCRGLSAT